MNLESFWNKGVESFQFILFEEELWYTSVNLHWLPKDLTMSPSHVIMEILDLQCILEIIWSSFLLSG